MRATRNGRPEGPGRPKIIKRKYSRRGCKECKRRKIKCDEGSPGCNNCTRLRKSCVYETTLQFRIEESKESAQVRSVEAPGTAPLTAKFLPTQTPYTPPVEHGMLDAAGGAEHHLRHHYVSGEYNNLPMLAEASMHNSLLEAELVLSAQDMQHLFDEASLLVHDIDQYVGPGLSELYHLMPHHAVPLDHDPMADIVFGIDDLSRNMHPDAYVSPTGTNSPLLSNAQLMEQCITDNALAAPHVDYLTSLTTTDDSYHLFPFAALIETNEVVRVLLNYLINCPYLLASMLAISATFQFNRTGEPQHDEARQRYTLICFKALGDAFAEHSGFKNAAVLSSNIEKLLLTVLVLTSYFTATTLLNDNIKSTWKAHLMGARELLLNYSKTTAGKPHEYHRISSGLALAKCWFFALEVSMLVHLPIQESTKVLSSSGVPSKKPAAIDFGIMIDTGYCDASDNPAYNEALSRVNILYKCDTLSDLNLYWGFSTTSVKIIVSYLQSVESAFRRGLARVPLRECFRFFSIFHQVTVEYVVPEVDQVTFLIPTTSRHHPDYEPLEERKVIPKSGIGADVDDSGNPIYYSWFDLCTQLHVDYMFITVCVSELMLGLPRSHPYLQEVVRKILDGCFFIKNKLLPQFAIEKKKGSIVVETDRLYLSRLTFDLRCIMVQSIFRHISGLVVDDLDFEMIELFFMGMVKLGNGSSLKSLDIVAKFKEERRLRRKTLGDAVDELAFDYYDKLNDIPFA